MNNMYEEITNAIIEQLENGQIPWRKPWAGVSDVISHETGKPYSLLNQLLKRPGEYITFLQCQKEGGHVKKGEKATSVYFWKMLKKQALDEDGQPLEIDGKPVMETIPILKSFKVFHIDQCEGIKPRWTQNMPATPAQPDKAAEKVLTDYVQREGIRLEIEISDKAYYSPAFDTIHIPTIRQYSSAAEYYSTAFHEAVHSTGHSKRLNRFSTGKAAAFGGEEYSKEELTAEIGAACILHQQGLETADSFKNSAGYIQGWLKALKDDRQMIIGAAARAEKAVKYILNQKNEPKAEEA